MSMSYDMGYGISAAGAFFNSRRTSEQNGAGAYRNIMGRGDKAEGYSGGLKYDANDVYLAVMFTQSYNAARFGSSDSSVYGYANKAQSFEAYAHYQFDFGLRPFVGYNQTKGKDWPRRQRQGLRRSRSGQIRRPGCDLLLQQKHVYLC